MDGAAGPWPERIEQQPGCSIAECLPRSYAAIDCFEASNGKSGTPPAGFLWLPTGRCIAHGWTRVWPQGLTFFVGWLVLAGHFVLTGWPDWRQAAPRHP